MILLTYKKFTMKTLKYLFFVSVLLIGSSPLYAQGWQRGGRQGGNPAYGPGVCINYLPGLTETQKTKILELEKSHQETMAGLREKRRSTFDFLEKDKIREEMLQNVEAHRSKVRSLLNEEQKKQYDLLHSRRNYGMRGAAQSGQDNQSPAGGYGRPGGRGFRGGRR